MRERELLRTIEFVERTRRPYQALFPNKQEDAFWNVAAFLMRAHVRGDPVTISTLADVAEIPYATAMRRIGDWISEGLIDKRKSTEKSFTLHASASMLNRFSNYAGNIKSLIAQTTGMRRAGEEEEDYYFGAGSYGAKLAPPPALVNTLSNVGNVRFLVHDDVFFTSVQNVWADYRSRIGSRRDFELLALPALYDRVVENARQDVSDYDIIVLNLPWLGEFAEAGYLRPVENRLYESGIDLLDFHPAVWATGRWKGQQQSVPLYSTVEVLAARNDLFDQANLPFPKTFDEVVRMGRKFHSPSHGRYGIVWNARSGMPIASSFAFFLACCGGSVVDVPKDGDVWSLRALDYDGLKVTLETDAALQTLDYMHRLKEISPPGILNMAWNEALDVFMAGKTAMAYCWSMRATRLEADARSKVRGKLRYLPQPAGNKGRSVCPLGGFLLAVPANLPESRVAAAFEAIRWLTSPEAIQSQMETGYPVLPRFSVNADPEMFGRSSLGPFINNLGRRNQLKTWQRPPLPFYRKVEQVLGEEIHRALCGEIGDAAALARAQGRIERIVADHRPGP